MTDIFSKDKRRKIMSKIRAKNTKPELIVRKYLFSKGYRYRLNVKSLPGSPDIVLKKSELSFLLMDVFGMATHLVTYIKYLKRIQNGGKKK